MTFFLRLILAAVLAALIGHFFFDEVTVIKVGSLAVVMLGFAYLFEYTRKRDRGGNHHGT